MSSRLSAAVLALADTVRRSPRPSIARIEPTRRPLRACAVLLGVLAGHVAAGTIHVPADVSTIQAGIVSAKPGDTVLVSPGIYHEALDFLGKDIRVISVAGPEVTVIDATGLDDSVVLFVSGEPPTTLLQGFTLTGGVGHRFWPDQQEREGGGILVANGACPRILECIIMDNHVTGDDAAGGGIRAYESSLGMTRIEGCLISDNSATGILGFGGGLYVSNAEITGCQIIHNWADTSGGGLGGTSIRLEDCLIADNTSYDNGGLVIETATTATVNFVSRVVIRDNVAFNSCGGGFIKLGQNQLGVLDGLVVRDNHAGHSCGGLSVGAPFNPLGPHVVRNGALYGNSSPVGNAGLASSGKLRLEHCTIVGNAIDVDEPVFEQCILRQLGSPLPADTLSVTWSNVEGGYPGTGNFDADPQFADLAGGDLHLLPGSPCIDQGDPAFMPAEGELDMDGESRLGGDRVDVGADEYTDCDGNGAPDAIDIAQGVLEDCDGNGLPDSCELVDCNGNGQHDACDIATGLAQDCDGNGVPDTCEWLDCDGDGVFDPCELVLGSAYDCNGNGVLDSCDIASGASFDSDLDGVPDTCQAIYQVPGDAADLEEAIGLLPEGGTIILASGVWTGPGFIDDFLIPTLPLTIEGAGGASACVLDASLTGVGWVIGAGSGTLTIRGMTFRGATNGLLSLTSSSNARFEDCVFEDNQDAAGAPSVGGAVDIGVGGKATFVRCIFSGNSAGLGGAVRVRGTASLDHCTFYGNTASSAGGSVRAQGSSVATLTNCIAWGGTSPFGAEISGSGSCSIVVQYCDVAGGSAGVGMGGGTLEWGAGNLALDPLFADSSTGDFHLLDGSPCINAADPGAAPDSDGSPAEMGALPWSPWSQLGGGIGGDWGLPSLTGEGALLPQSVVRLELGSSPPGMAAVLIAGPLTPGTPFKGGIFWPMPTVTVFLVVGADGQIAIEAHWPAGVPGTSAVCMQAWIPDDSATAGYSGSGGLKAVTPP